MTDPAKAGIVFILLLTLVLYVVKGGFLIWCMLS